MASGRNAEEQTMRDGCAARRGKGMNQNESIYDEPENLVFNGLCIESD